SFEPAFADELAVIMEWAFDYLQRDGGADPDERTWLRDETGGSVYLRLTTAPLEQPGKRVDDAFRQGAIDGAYWLRKPGPNCDVVIAYQGAVAQEAIAAAGQLTEARRDVGVLAVTSSDRLNAGWTAAQRARARGNDAATSHIESLFAELPRHCSIVTVLDGHPATLAWLGSVSGHRAISLGVEHFGQTGSIQDLYRHYGIDRNGILTAVSGLTNGRSVPIRRVI
ncbi:MAG: transketolase, partial [Pseudomonadota bacterium]